MIHSLQMVRPYLTFLQSHSSKSHNERAPPCFMSAFYCILKWGDVLTEDAAEKLEIISRHMKKKSDLMLIWLRLLSLLHNNVLFPDPVTLYHCTSALMILL